MLVTFDPEDGTEPRTWEFDPDDVGRKDAEDIEHHFGQPWEMFVDALRVRNAKARGALLWYLLRQEHPRMPFKDTPNFKMRQMKVEMSSAELREVWKQISRTKVDEGTMEAFEAAFERDLQDALEREGKAYEGEIVEAPNLPKLR